MAPSHSPSADASSRSADSGDHKIGCDILPQTSMRTIMGARHRTKILEFLRPGTRMLEWGMGGATVWLSKHLPTDATLVSVEHDPKWFNWVREQIGENHRVRLLLREATGNLGRNSTIEEEEETCLESFVHAVDGEEFDLIMINGNARHACLLRAAKILAQNGIVMLHDAQRAWYDEAKAVFTNYGHIGSCPDYPSPHLWWGGRTELQHPASGSQKGDLPLVICFYTAGTDYEVEARRLMASCETIGIDHYIAPVAPRGSWEENCSLKSEFVRETWKSSGRPVLWVDADAVLHQLPELLRGTQADFAIHRCRGWEFASGTLFFNQTAEAELLLDRWIQRCRAQPRIWDQVHLDLAWEDVITTIPLETLWLPETYCRIFDLHEGRSQLPCVIEHFQASRRLKSKTSTAAPVRFIASTPSLKAARRASRPRFFKLAQADGVTREMHNAKQSLPTNIRGYLPLLVEIFAAETPANGRILTLTTGIGVLWQLLSEKGYQAYGLAPTRAYLSNAEVFAPGRLSLCQSDKIPFSDGEFSAVFAHGWLDHLADAAVVSALTELHRIVRDRIFLVIETTPDPEPRWPDGPRDRSWWLAQLRCCGFSPLPAPAGLPDDPHSRSAQGSIVIRAGRLPSQSILAGGSIQSTPVNLGDFAQNLRTFFGCNHLLEVHWPSATQVTLRCHSAESETTTETLEMPASYNPRLPLNDDFIDATFNLGSFGTLDDEGAAVWLRELARVTRRFLWINVGRHPTRDRNWWEGAAETAGWRRHPRSQLVTGYAELDSNDPGFVLVFEKIPTAASLFRSELYDALRSTNEEAHALTARYELAACRMTPGQRALDYESSGGFGAATLAYGQSASHVLALTDNTRAIAYGSEQHASVNSRLCFRNRPDPFLLEHATSTFDLIVCDNYLSSQPDPISLVCALARVLKQGGILQLSVSTNLRNADGSLKTGHLHCFNLTGLMALIQPWFKVLEVYEQKIGGVSQRRGLERVSSASQLRSQRNGFEYWIFVAEKL